jgi:hypothetical protein
MDNYLLGEAFCDHRGVRVVVHSPHSLKAYLLGPLIIRL